MKRFLALVLVVILAFTVAGCANGFLCKNKDTIMGGLQFVINQANSIIAAVQSTYPGIMPAAAQAVIDKAQLAKNLANQALAASCPTDAQLTEAQGQVAASLKTLNLAVLSGAMKLGK